MKYEESKETPEQEAKSHPKSFLKKALKVKGGKKAEAFAAKKPEAKKKLALKR